MSELVELRFSTAVLGPATAIKLKLGKVTQSIRSRKEAVKYMSHNGQKLAILLDRKLIFYATQDYIKPIDFRQIGIWDAEIGGFDTVYSLQNALKKGGFRFREFKEYSGFKLGFVMIKGTETPHCKLTEDEETAISTYTDLKERLKTFSDEIVERRIIDTDKLAEDMKKRIARGEDLTAEEPENGLEDEGEGVITDLDETAKRPKISDQDWKKFQDELGV